MRSCVAGSLLKPPMLSLMIQDITMAFAVEMGRKELAASAHPVKGPWDLGEMESGSDGTLVHFFKGNVSVTLQTSETQPAVRNVVMDIAKRIASSL
jgi:hypothetical protein